MQRLCQAAFNLHRNLIPQKLHWLFLSLVARHNRLLFP